MSDNRDLREGEQPEDPVAFFESIAKGPWADPEAAGHRAARAMVEISRQLLDERTSATGVETIAAQLEAVLAPLQRRARPTRYRSEDLPGVRKVRPNATGQHPIAGPANPIAPPIALRREGARAFGEVTYDLRFEGLPGLVQGGFIAAAFDLLLGQAVALAGAGGMTGALSVRYRSPTPLYEPLRYESWLDRVDGRKTFARASLIVVESGQLCAEADGVFIAPRHGVASVIKVNSDPQPGKQ
jgi:acyl-coenzyme A thioesterase PaaI-like protein